MSSIQNGNTNLPLLYLHQWESVAHISWLIHRGSYIVAPTLWLKHSGSSSIPETISKVCYDVKLLDPTEEGFTSHTFLICLCILFVFVFYLYDEKKGKTIL